MYSQVTQPACRAASLLLIALAAHIDVAMGSDACSQIGITTSAEVSDSDGSAFRTSSYFQSRDMAAVRHLTDQEQVVAVEGPLGWIRLGDQFELGDDSHQGFALGHQYHAFILHFDALVDNARDSNEVEFRGETCSARTGDYPYGGTVHLVADAETGRPAGMRFELPGRPPFDVGFSDWRPFGETELPYHVEIVDGERVFDYRYTGISTDAREPIWFHDAVPAPDLDEVQIYRLHRELLAAHCLGDAERLAALSTDEIVSANGGDLSRVSKAATRDRFSSLFERLDYTEYHDLAPPVIEVADSGELGWIAVNVRAVGNVIESGEPFDLQWAWIMIVRKIDGRWLHAGNASNVAR